ncbi:hypothetical protein EGO52_11200 [Curtobacterium flaccumfaciens]|nr:hypothetical protein [Curtobacterium flaccumfaciens]
MGGSDRAAASGWCPAVRSCPRCRADTDVSSTSTRHPALGDRRRLAGPPDHPDRRRLDGAGRRPLLVRDRRVRRDRARRRGHRGRRRADRDGTAAAGGRGPRARHPADRPDGVARPGGADTGTPWHRR